MFCKNCGTNNIEGTNFCIKCGASLKVVQPEPVIVNQNPTNNIGQINNAQMPGQVIQPTFEQKSVSNVQQVENSVNVSNAPLNYFMFMVAMFLKPFKSYKEEESKLANTKTSIIFSLIVAIVMILVSIIKTILNLVIVKSYYTSKTSFEFDRLKYIKWGELIGQNLLIYVGIIVGIALVYYILSLIFKKNSRFIKLLSITAAAQIPFVLLSMIASPLLAKVWAPLSLIAMVLGIFYTFFIWYELINDDLQFEGDTKIYFNLICLGILIVGGYYAFLKIFSAINVISFLG